MKTGGGRPPHHTRVRMVHPLWYRVLLPLLCVCVRLRTARARIHTAAALPAATTTAAYVAVHVCKCLCGQTARQPASQPAEHEHTSYAHKYHHTCCPVYVCGCACIIRGVHYDVSQLLTINYMSHVMCNSIYALKMHNANKMLQKKC